MGKSFLMCDAEKYIQYYRDSYDDSLSEQPKIVATCGCFDILHAGHIDYLTKAKKLGDFLVVFLNSDASVRKLKGKDRPICNLQERMKMLAALECVDIVIVFEEDKPLHLIKKILPDIWVKGGDNTIDTIDQEERELVERLHGRVEVIPVDSPDKSTSNLINRVKVRKVGTVLLDKEGSCECSVCKSKWIGAFSFCPNCGAEIIAENLHRPTIRRS